MADQSRPAGPAAIGPMEWKPPGHAGAGFDLARGGLWAAGAAADPAAKPPLCAAAAAPIYSILGHYSVRAQMRSIVKNGHEISHNGLIYAYPDGSTDAICCTAPIFREAGWEAAWGSEAAAAKPLPQPREAGVKSEGSDMERSMRRARAKLRRLALANSFDYFVTLTLDPARIDRYDPAVVVKALGRWTDNMVRRHGLRYILVPELHQDGALHFHGFMAGNGLKAVDSGVEWSGRPVYNLPQWTLGFTTAQRLYGDYHAAVGYCCKYIGKQAAQRPCGRWYYSGGALKEPAKIYADLDYRDIDNAAEFSIPGAKIKVLHNKREENL